MIMFRFTLFLVLLTQLSQAQGEVKGFVTDRTTGKPLPGTRISLQRFVSDTVRIIPQLARLGDNPDSIFRDSTYTAYQRIFADSAGFFAFTEVPAGVYKLQAFYFLYEKNGRRYGEWDDSYGFIVKDCLPKDQHLQLAVFCPYDSTKNLDHCPDCGAKNHILEIVYGMPAGPFKPKRGKYYNGYCTVERCHPTKKCSRCGREF